MNAGALVAGLAALGSAGRRRPTPARCAQHDRQHATYKQDGALVRSSGAIGCTGGERIAIRVSVSQASTGARARGSAKEK